MREWLPPFVLALQVVTVTIMLYALIVIVPAVLEVHEGVIHEIALLKDVSRQAVLPLVARDAQLLDLICRRLGKTPSDRDTCR